MKKKIQSYSSQIKEKEVASVELLKIIDLIQDLNGLENLGKGLLEILRKIEVDLREFNRGIDDVESQHKHNCAVTCPKLMKEEKAKLSS